MENQIEQAKMISAAVQNGVLVVMVVVFWIGFAFVLAKIAEKIGMAFKSSFILALIPIANLVLLVQMAAKPIWWVVLLLIPYVNLVFIALMWGRSPSGWGGRHGGAWEFWFPFSISPCFWFLPLGNLTCARPVHKSQWLSLFPSPGLRPAFWPTAFP